MSLLSDPQSTAVPTAPTAVSKAIVVAWLNNTFKTNYSCIKEVPAKAAAKLLNGMLGRELCPLSNIQFDDASSEAARNQNITEVLMTLAPSAGYPGGLTPTAWRQQTSFSELLKFWRWLYCLQGQHPLPPDFDNTLTTLGRRTLNLRSADASHLGPSRAAPDAASSIVDDDACDPITSLFPTGGAEHHVEIARCTKCAGAARIIARDAKRLKTLRKAHQDLLVALADQDLPRVVAILEAAA